MSQNSWSGNPDLIWHHNANYINVGQDIPDPICDRFWSQPDDPWHTHGNREQYVRNLDLRLFHVQKKQSIFYNFSVFLGPWSLGPGAMVLLYVHRHHIAWSGLASATPPPKAPTHHLAPPQAKPSQS